MEYMRSFFPRIFRTPYGGDGTARDQGGLGLLLCLVSSFVTLAVLTMVTYWYFSPAQHDLTAAAGDDLQSFPTAAGPGSGGTR
jgi:hypothetical protein